MKDAQTLDKLHQPHKTAAESPSNLGSLSSSEPPKGQSNLSRRGRSTRTAVTAGEIAFCAYFVLTGNVKQASLQAGYSAWWGYELLKMPRVQPILREFETRKRDEAWETAKSQIVLTRELLDELFIERLVNMKTHPKVGDLAIVKMFETGYKRTGDIQAARVTAEAKAGVSTQTPQLYAKRLYLPEWRREAIEKIQKAEREASGIELGTRQE
jgi:Terminase small subunit